jgi:hypothetical protein
VNYRPIKPTCEMQTSGAESAQEPRAATQSDRERQGAYVSPWQALHNAHQREQARVERVYGRLPSRGTR